MPSSSVEIAAALARGIELAGIAVMVLGGLLAILGFVLRVAQRWRGTGTKRGGADAGGEPGPVDVHYRVLRANLGRAILLGLEFLVAADIVGTVAIEPSFRSLGVLALIVAIRTFLSFSLELEISGRWPWQSPSSSPPAAPPATPPAA